MDFAFSDKVRELQLRVQNFMDTHVTPNEEVYYQQVEAGGRWCVPPILDELKAKAKQEGLWNLFLPESERGAGLT
ncbi:MAG: acyl-CoA dehydrogenase, partial [Porticoccaceae bacterium]